MEQNPYWAIERYEDGRQGFYPATEREADILRKLGVTNRRMYMDLRHAGKSVGEASERIKHKIAEELKV